MGFVKGSYPYEEEGVVFRSVLQDGEEMCCPMDIGWVGGDAKDWADGVREHGAWRNHFRGCGRDDTLCCRLKF